VKAKFERNLIEDPSSLESDSLFLRVMATAHSATSINKELVGNAVDVRMFQSTGWVFTFLFLYLFSYFKIENS
jgi:hypothetical protein